MLVMPLRKYDITLMVSMKVEGEKAALRSKNGSSPLEVYPVAKSTTTYEKRESIEQKGLYRVSATSLEEFEVFPLWRNEQRD
jgi:hypothetical protein